MKAESELFISALRQEILKRPQELRDTFSGYNLDEATAAFGVLIEDMLKNIRHALKDQTMSLDIAFV